MQNKYNCPVDATISKIGGKYKAVILYHLGNNTLRYNQIHKKIPAITDKMLAQQLRELENDNLIIKKICSCAKFLSQLLIIFDTNFRKIFSEFNTRNGGIFALRFFDI